MEIKWKNICLKIIKPLRERNLLIRVTGFWGLTRPGEPGKSWNFILTLARTEESWKMTIGPGNSWKSSLLK